MTALARDPLPEPRAAFGAIRMIADDMTGALDTAAAFAGLASPLRVGIAVQDSRSLVLDIGTRERAARTRRPQRRPPRRCSRPPRPALLLQGRQPAARPCRRGARRHPRNDRFDRVIIAPALPEQGRRTRSGRQVWIQGGTGRRRARTWAQLSRQPDIPWRSLVRRACRTAASASSTRKRRRTSTASSRMALPPAAACSGSAPRASRGLSPGPWPARPAPICGGGTAPRLIGTDHAVTAAQLEAVASLRREATDTAGIIALLAQSGAAFVTTALPAGTPRPAARATIAARFASLIPDVPQPARSSSAAAKPCARCCRRWAPPASMCSASCSRASPCRASPKGAGGHTVISKSGAFGEPGLFADLAARASSAPTSAGKIPS